MTDVQGTPTVAATASQQAARVPAELAPIASQWPGDPLGVALRAADAAAAVLREHRARPVAVHHVKSSQVDVVTAADLASEELIRRMIATARPSDEVLGEEGGGPRVDVLLDAPAAADVAGGPARGDSADGPLTWCVDPLDGTVNFLYDVGSSGVSIAALDADAVLFGVVHDIRSGSCFLAVRGYGAWQRDHTGAWVRLRLESPPPLSQALVGTGFGYIAARRCAQAEVLRTVLPEVRDIRRIGSAALDLCWVAAGNLDGYYEQGLQPWDRAAGELIAREAGALVSGLGGAGPSHTLVVAAAPPLHAALCDLLDRAGTGRDMRNPG